MRWLEEKRTDRFEVRIEPTLKENASDIADLLDMSVSDYVRTLIIKDVRKNYRFIEGLSQNKKSP